MNQQPPSYDPSDAGSLQGVMSFVLKKFLQSTDGQLPASIIAYDPVNNVAQVQPMIQVKTTDGTLISRAPIASVPVLALGCGTAFIRFNLKPGDFGWISANDRDISLFMQSLSQSGPNTNRLHSFSDSIFIPDKIRNYVVNPADSAADLIIQSADGVVAIAVSPVSVTIRAPTSILLNTPLTVLAGALTLAPGFDVNGDMPLTGKFGCNGAAPQGPVTLTDYPASTTGEVRSLVNQLAALLIANGQATV